MKKFLLIALPLAVFFASCQKEQTPVADETVAGDYTFTAYIEDGVKTELNSDLDVLWCAGDSISVFDEAGTNFKFTTSDSGKTATFTKVTEGEMVGSTFYAVYPYHYNASIENGTITTNTAALYTLSGASFTRSASAVMAAKTSDTELHFKNVSSLLQFTIPSGVSIKKLYFYAGGQDISGEFEFNLDDQGTPVITKTPTKGDGITVMAEEDSFPAGTYYLPVIPGTYKNLRIQITYADDKACTVSDAFSLNQLTAERNKARNIGTIYDGRSWYKWLTFEDEKIPTIIGCNATKTQLSIDTNPRVGAANGSAKVLKICTPDGGNGYIGIDLQNINGSVRERITGIVLHYKPTGNKYCPKVKLGGIEYVKGPLKIGSSVSEAGEYTGDAYQAMLQKDYWNQLTFKASQFGVDNFKSIIYITINPILYKGGGESSDKNATVLIDNIGFCFD